MWGVAQAILTPCRKIPKISFRDALAGPAREERGIPAIDP